MIEKVFISDLHLHPQDAQISQRFTQFIEWATKSVQSVYILGDFFHVWPGDDSLDEWSSGIAAQLASLNERGISVYFMAGNRDFLIGKKFVKLAKIQLLTEPAFIILDNIKTVLVHGDRYCTHDKSHQWLRRITRNRIFSFLFQLLPLSRRQSMVNTVREHSQNNSSKTYDQMQVVIPVLAQHVLSCGASQVIHGHTHKPGHWVYKEYGLMVRHYILSDWDDKPQLLCYDKSNGIYFVQI